jgi:hypothetical protein
MIQKSVTLAGKSTLVWVPNDYDPTKAYNCEVMLQGSGEMDTPGTSKLLVNGLGPVFNNNATANIQAILISVEQDEPYEPYFNEPGTYLTAIAAAYKINKFFLSGLSYGCQDWLNWFFQPNQDLSMIGGLFMLSPDPTTLPQYGGPAMDYTLFAKNGIFLYCGVGTADGFIVGCQAMVAGVKAAGGTAYLDTWPGVAHSNPVWSDFWSLAWVSQAMGVSHYTQEVTWDATVTPVPVPPVQTPANVVLTTATPAQLQATTPTVPTLYINPSNKLVTAIWNGSIWQ